MSSGSTKTRNTNLATVMELKFVEQMLQLLLRTPQVCLLDFGPITHREPAVAQNALSSNHPTRRIADSRSTYNRWKAHRKRLWSVRYRRISGSESRVAKVERLQESSSKWSMTTTARPRILVRSIHGLKPEISNSSQNPLLSKII